MARSSTRGRAATKPGAVQIPARKLGGRWVIPKKRFHAWLDECTEPATDEAEGLA
ncbi:hypothetical protein [Micromonospora echinaurantiaca]|uniref:hypothetical protein n=1 Tax=Micromonospora echinaurantiaca TaxID=47857 RepID=UPI00378FB026